MFTSMTAKMKDVNDIIVDLDGCNLVIKYPEVTYSFWKMRIPYDNDIDLTIILSNLLVYLDCTITFSNQRLLFTTHMMYEYHISEYYYYILHIEDQFIYNKYIDLLYKRHQDNVQFELDNPIILEVTKAKTKAAAKVRVKSKFIKQVTKDMFTNEETYIYSNSTTGKVINSDDPNLLDSLNGLKPKKEKRVKSVGVPMTSMTFSFKKKTDD